MRKTWIYKTPTSPDLHCCYSTDQRNSGKVFVTFSLFQSPSPTCRVEEEKASSSTTREEASLDAKITAPPFPRQNKNWLQRGHAVSTLFNRRLAKQTTQALGRCKSPRGFYLIFFLNSGQHFNAGFSLSPKVWFYGSSYCLSLILKRFATYLIEIKVVSTCIFWVLNSCKPLTMRCGAASKKQVQKKHFVVQEKLSQPHRAHRGYWGVSQPLLVAMRVTAFPSGLQNQTCPDMLLLRHHSFTDMIAPNIQP